MTKYDIHNPTKSRRVIYDGINNNRVEIAPGETIQGADISDIVASRLLSVKGDLQLTKLEGQLSEEAAPAPQAPAPQAPAPQAPAPLAPPAREMKIDDAGVTVIKASAGKKTTLRMP